MMGRLVEMVGLGGGGGGKGELQTGTLLTFQFFAELGQLGHPT